MYRFLESICYDGEGFPLLSYHQKRIDRVFNDHYSNHHTLRLSEILSEKITGSAILKVRLLFNDRDHQIEAIPYKIRPVSSLQVVHSDIAYDYKYADRSGLAELFQQRNNADDILIVRKGLITDTSYANVALLKNNIWYTPQKPLLQGVRRAKLLDEGRIATSNIHIEELPQYERLSLFNAMIDLEEITVPVGNIL